MPAKSQDAAADGAASAASSASAGVIGGGWQNTMQAGGSSRGGGPRYRVNDGGGNGPEPSAARPKPLRIKRLRGENAGTEAAAAGADGMATRNLAGRAVACSQGGGGL